MSSAPERQRIAAGQIIYHQGQPADRAYLVLSGAIELRSDSVVAERGVGDVFGELALVDDSTREASAVVTLDCELLAFTSGDLRQSIETADPLLRIALSAIVARYSETVEHFRQLSGETRHSKVHSLWSAHASAAHRILSFDHALRGGLERDEFDVFFQPIVRLASGRLAGVEALIRWRHPERGLLMPSEFIPFAEASGIISDVTDFCLRKVAELFPELKATAMLNRVAVEPLYASINVSGIDLAQSAFAAKAVSIFCEAGVEPTDIRLEVTESILITDAERCARTLANCRDQGFKIAIDDFGTGYSSLNYLGTLPIAVLKMDRTFCQSLLPDVAGSKIIAAILHLAKELGLPVTAEGVETTEQRDILHAMGCDSGQGYLFGPALNHTATVRLIASWRSFSAAEATHMVPPAA